MAKQRKTKIIFFSYPTYSDGPRYLYEYIKQKYPNKYDLLWYCENQEEYERLQKEKINCVQNNTEKAKEEIETSDIIFDTHGIALKYNLDNIIYVNLWHGVGPKKGGYYIPEKEISSFDLDYCEKMQKNIDYFITPSSFWNNIHSQLFNTKMYRMLDLGSLRNEQMLKSNLNIKAFEKYNKVIIYMPTFRDNGLRNDSPNINKKNILFAPEYKETEFLKYLEKNNYLLVVRYHPSEKSKDLIPEHPNILNLNNEYLQENNIELYQLLSKTDILITDYSSVYLDYLLLDKPIIFLHSDKEAYYENRGCIFEDYDFWFFGNIVHSYTGLIKVLKAIFKDGDSNAVDRNNKTKFFWGKGYLKKNKKVASSTYNYFFSNNYKLKSKITINDYKKLKSSNESLVLINQKNQKLLLEYKNKLDNILNSRSYKVVVIIRKIYNKIRNTLNKLNVFNKISGRKKDE